MMEEHFMRGWNDGHDRFSADIDRGLQFLGGMIRRVSKRQVFGEGSYFARLAAVYRPTKRAATARITKRR